jgi:hypothetical protein
MNTIVTYAVIALMLDANDVYRWTNQNAVWKLWSSKVWLVFPILWSEPFLISRIRKTYSNITSRDSLQTWRRTGERALVIHPGSELVLMSMIRGAGSARFHTWSRNSVGRSLKHVNIVKGCFGIMSLGTSWFDDCWEVAL